MSERRTGPWTKEEHAETSERLARVKGEVEVDDCDALWMGNEALPRALAEIERLKSEEMRAHDEVLDKIAKEVGALYLTLGPFPALEMARAEIERARRLDVAYGTDEQAINAEVEKRALGLMSKNLNLGLGTAFWRGIVRPGVEREARLRISSDAGWAIAKARLECLDKVNAEIARLTSAPAKPAHDSRMAADIFGGAAEIPGLCSRIARAQAEVDDLTQALREHPDAKGMDLGAFLVSATADEIRKACSKVGIRSDIFFTAMMSKEPKPAPPEAEACSAGDAACEAAAGDLRTHRRSPAASAP